MADLSPASFMDLANRIKTDEDLAASWEWNVMGNAHNKPATKDLKQMEDFCLIASSESHEHGACVKSKGEIVGTPLGPNLSLTAGLSGIMDRAIGNWIKKN